MLFKKFELLQHVLSEWENQIFTNQVANRIKQLKWPPFKMTCILNEYPAEMELYIGA